MEENNVMLCNVMSYVTLVKHDYYWVSTRTMNNSSVSDDLVSPLKSKPSLMDVE